MPNKNVRDRALVRMLLHLDLKQQKGFHDYLSSPLFNTNPSLLVLSGNDRRGTEKLMVQ